MFILCQAIAANVGLHVVAGLGAKQMSEANGLRDLLRNCPPTPKR